ncbi:type II CRISPR RNA-guided endonuclease Cas9 [Flavobacterium xinjiangense]|uniref:CRISPR-associated endonuclease Csn1 n=1 Tax=Flavobacterium xinjiangense TaxID=178356 RepID=A0A1M7DKA7_9FLAO|nr:type II CRISPR RNA-guided endonuclease Cas9 [Flavobacterium xinjiangense]SHL79951.1 CRISPR-associated endonuclease Csn1 [Flavobacterium xinjiangense]
MSKTIAYDLGTNSIGWSIREDQKEGNQILNAGVITFNKGVGEEKNIEYSLAASRTGRRSLRRRYQSHKYKLWSTLEILITSGYCPMTIEELDLWRKYTKGIGRKYPVNAVLFNNWIKLDFNNDGKPDYTSPYELRSELINQNLDFTLEENRHKLGRVLYHIAQHRAFKSSKKVQSDDSKEVKKEIIDEEYIGAEAPKVAAFTKFILSLGIEIKETVGATFYDAETKGIRIRENLQQYVVRKQLQQEIKSIFDFQVLSFDALFGKEIAKSSIFWNRPLRSQKGTIGKCTLEPNKYRCPVSHPEFEVFRAWSFLNNIKFRNKQENDSQWTKLPLEIKEAIYQKLFLGRLKADFEFSEIIDFVEKYNQHRNWELNYKAKTNVAASPVSARLQAIFGENWKLFTHNTTKTRINKKGIAHNITYTIEDIWHILFSYDDEEEVERFASENLELNEKQTKSILLLWFKMPVAYGMLSSTAIKNINVFLQKGLIYTEAVLLSKIPSLLKETWANNEDFLISEIGNIIDTNREEKKDIAIVNNLIAKYKSLELEEQFGYKNVQYKLDLSDKNDVLDTCIENYGAKTWEGLDEKIKELRIKKINDFYQKFFSNSKRDYFKSPHLLDTLKRFLDDNFNLPKNELNKLYHPSQIEIYPPAKEQYYKHLDQSLTLLDRPDKTGAFKNPMAMRTLFELRKLTNYLIITGQIEQETRVVVEVARELNDANMRWAIETYQNRRREENKEFALAIVEILEEFPNSKANPESNEDIDKFRLWLEQIEDDTTNDGKSEYTKYEWANTKSKVYKAVSSAKEMIDKYRLWREQSCKCMYTGRPINMFDLFSENNTDFEHTIPRSISFDNSLANLTVCDFAYNRTIKKNKLPTSLENYENDTTINGKYYTAIKPRLIDWEKKVESIKNNIEFWKKKSKQASDKEFKDKAIRQKHLWKMDLDYWQNKIHRFTTEEVTIGFKNSQLVDTQLISKYAFHYLKTVFNKVEVQKGSITAEFRKIFGVQDPNEKKSRDSHSHHAKDAAILTLIPSANKREEILKKAYSYYESNYKQYTETPYKGFSRNHIDEINDNTLINNIANDQRLIPANKKVRASAKIVYFKDNNGNKIKDEEGNPISKYAKGDSIRGQLHKETFLGAVKLLKKDENGKAIRNENGNFILDDTKYVTRKSLVYKKNNDSPGFSKLEEIEKCIVDKNLFQIIKKQVETAGGFKEALTDGVWMYSTERKDKDGKIVKNAEKINKIRRIRVFTADKNPPIIKKQTHQTEKPIVFLENRDHKQNYYATSGDGYLYLFYEGAVKGKLERDYECYSLLEVSKLNKIKATTLEDLLPKLKTVKNTEIPLRAILKSGQKVFFFKENMDELKELPKNELMKRLYRILYFEKDGLKKDGGIKRDGRIQFKFHSEARQDTKLENAESSLDFENPHPKLRLSKGNFDFAIENKDFTINADGTIKWL